MINKHSSQLLTLSIFMAFIAGASMARAEQQWTSPPPPPPQGWTSAPPPPAPAAPVQQTYTAPRENCEAYRYASQRDNGQVVQKGVVGALMGAGLGAASGAIIDGGSGAGKGAGVGAIVGLGAGSLYGLNGESNRTAAARDAYYACMARQGY